VDLLYSFTVRERDHRIHDPFTAEKLATLGRAIHLLPGTSILDLACGSGEMLCTWSREHGITGTGVDLNADFVNSARTRAAELGVSDQVTFVHGDAAGHVSTTPVDVAACVGASWIGGGVPGTLALLERSVRPGGLLLVGEPFWRNEPPGQTAIEGSGASAKADFHDLPGLIESFAQLGWDTIEMVLADEDSWDRYVAAQWFTVRNWLDANPDHESADEFRAELDTAPLRYVRFQRRYVGWGVFALKRR
jgi:SAM-dependent methyltransferase